MTSSQFSLADQREYWDRRWEQQKTPNEYQLTRGDTVLEFIRSLSLDHPRILDYGCGTGWFTEQLSHVGEATGVDLSETAIAIAESQFPRVTFMAVNLFELSLPEGYFDVVVSQEVIAHVEDQVGYLDRIAYLLRPGGHLVITTANKFVMDRLGWPQPFGHIEKYMNMREFKRLLHARFRVLRTTSIMPIGERGILRVINSYELNTALGWLISRRYLQSLKEWAGFGYTLIALAQKKF